MTVVIVGALEMPSVAELAASVRRRGFKVLTLESMSLVALFMLTERVVAVAIHEARAPADWPAARERLSKICPATMIIFVPTGDQRTAEHLACQMLGAQEE